MQALQQVGSLGTVTGSQHTLVRKPAQLPAEEQALPQPPADHQPAAGRPPLPPHQQTLAGEAAQLPAPTPLQFSSSSSSEEPSPSKPAASGDSNGSVSAGFGSVLHFGGSEPTSRRSSFAPQQAAEAAAEAAAAAGEDASAGLAAPPPGWGMQPASPPQAQPDSEAGGAASGAEAEAAADAQQSPQLAEVEDAGPPPAAEEEAWPEQPVTSFQVAARPLFGSTQGECRWCSGGYVLAR